jgi:sortase A
MYVKKAQVGLRRFNNFLTIIIIGLGLYLIIMPLAPQLVFWYKQKTGKISDTIVYSDSGEAGSKPIPQDNRLVIPQMGLDATVNEGKYANTLKHGLWRRPMTSTPDQGGNTVIVGHRFTYKDPAIFYHLDKVKEGDNFALYWQGKEYLYTVKEIRIVNPDQIEIEENTDEPVLTLYTCTPMWTSKQRLVIIAKPMEGRES